MIVGIGVDIVDIHRFDAWHTKSRSSLARIFSESEIDYCLAVAAKSAERFAIRYAAKEAFFKAINRKQLCSLLTACKAFSIPDGTGIPAIDWNMLQIQPWHVYCSLSHSNMVAIAYVVVEE